MTRTATTAGAVTVAGLAGLLAAYEATAYVLRRQARQRRAEAERRADEMIVRVYPPAGWPENN